MVRRTKATCPCIFVFLSVFGLNPSSAACDQSNLGLWRLTNTPRGVLTVLDTRSEEGTPHRICPSCRNGSPILDGQAIWPTGYVCSHCGDTAPMEIGIPLFAPKLADTISGFDPKSFEMLAEIEDNHFWFVPRNRMLTGLIQKYFPHAQDILEVGCGNGTVLSALAKAGVRRHLVGSELHPSGLAVAVQRLGKNAELVQMDARDIMAENAFDVIGAYDVIEHIAEDETVLQSMYKALRPGGGVVIAVPQHPWLWSTADEVAYHERRYKLGELEEKLKSNGFRPVFSTSYCSFLLPIMVASRLKERWRKKNSQQSEMSDIEAKPPSAANAVLKSVLQGEVSAILAGVRFPLGGSRIVVATRV